MKEKTRLLICLGTATTAQMAYLEAIDLATSNTRRGQSTKRLSQYCEMETLALVKLARFFQDARERERVSNRCPVKVSPIEAVDSGEQGGSSRVDNHLPGAFLPSSWMQPTR
jgi:hypothetical protein